MRYARLVAIAALAALGAAPALAGEPRAEAELVGAKCTLCHTDLRIYTADSARLREIVQRMTEKNPAWFRDVDSAHLMESLEKMLADPGTAAMRKSWEETVARGKQLFADRALGTTGKSCADCHDAAKLGRVKDDYPKFNAALGRHESLEERLNAMIVAKMGGTGFAVGDERATALSLYLKSLR